MTIEKSSYSGYIAQTAGTFSNGEPCSYGAFSLFALTGKSSTDAPMEIVEGFFARSQCNETDANRTDARFSYDGALDLTIDKSLNTATLLNLDLEVLLTTQTCTNKVCSRRGCYFQDCMDYSNVVAASLNASWTATGSRTLFNNVEKIISPDSFRRVTSQRRSRPALATISLTLEGNTYKLTFEDAAISEDKSGYMIKTSY